MSSTMFAQNAEANNTLRLHTAHAAVRKWTENGGKTMGLDITFKRMREIKCKNCGEIVGRETIDRVSSSGRCWYDLLEKIGYYTPYENRAEDFEDEWYGNDMVLDDERAKLVADKIPKGACYEREVENLVCVTIVKGDVLAVNADW